MKINKGISVLLTSILISGMLVGCSSEFDSTEYLDKDGKKLIEKYKDREKYDYIKVESLEPFVSEDMYKDKYIMITGKVTNIDEEGLACYKLGFDFEENHTTEFIRVFILKNSIDVKFKKGDIITVYGKCNGIKTKRYDEASFDYWHINAYFLELGDTTNKEKSTKKDNVEAKATEDKKVETTKDKNEDKTLSQDNNKSSKKQVNIKKDNDNNTKEKHVTKEEPIYDEYGYDQYGNYNSNEDLNNDREWNDEDYERWNDIYGDDEEDYEEEDGYIKDGTQLGENEWNYDNNEEPIQEADDYYEE